MNMCWKGNGAGEANLSAHRGSVKKWSRNSQVFGDFQEVPASFGPFSPTFGVAYEEWRERAKKTGKSEHQHASCPDAGFPSCH